MFREFNNSGSLLVILVRTRIVNSGTDTGTYQGDPLEKQTKNNNIVAGVFIK